MSIQDEIQKINNDSKKIIGIRNDIIKIMNEMEV